MSLDTGARVRERAGRQTPQVAHGGIGEGETAGVERRSLDDGGSRGANTRRQLARACHPRGPLPLWPVRCNDVGACAVRASGMTRTAWRPAARASGCST